MLCRPDVCMYEVVRSGEHKKGRRTQYKEEQTDMARSIRQSSWVRGILPLAVGSLIVLAAVGIAFAGCGSTASTTTEAPVVTTAVTSGAGADAVGSGAEIIVANGQLNMTELQIVRGQAVTFVNGEDDTAKQHRLVADDGTFDTGVLDPGATYSFTFKTAGTFPFHDQLDPNIKGTITVK